MYVKPQHSQAGVRCSSVYSARVTNEDYARAMNEAIRRLSSSTEGQARLAKIIEALRAHPGELPPYAAT